MRYAVWPILGFAEASLGLGSEVVLNLRPASADLRASASRSEAERIGMRNDLCNAARAGEEEAEQPRIGGRLRGISAPEHV